MNRTVLMLSELIEALELKIIWGAPSNPPVDAAEIEELDRDIEQYIRDLPYEKDFRNLALPGKTHEDFLIYSEKIDFYVNVLQGADDDEEEIIPNWEEKNRDLWERNRSTIKETVEAIRGAKVILREE